MMDESKLVAFTVALTSLHLYGAFLPPVSEIALSYQTVEEKQVLREAEMIGTLYLLSISAITSSLAKSALPLLLATLIAGSMFATYEYAMARVVVARGA